MSLRWRKSVSIDLAPGRVAVREAGRGWRTSACRVAEPAAAGPHDMAPALAALEGLLAEYAIDHAAVSLTVSDGWVRSVRLPWPGSLLAPAALSTLARFTLEESYGGPMPDWRIAVHRPMPDAPGLACAVPAAFLESLDAVLAPRKLRLRSLMPRAVAAYTLWRRWLPVDGLFVHLEGATIASVVLSGGYWDHLQIARCGDDLQGELRRAVVLAQLRAGHAGAACIDAPTALRESISLDDVPGGEWLQPFRLKGDALLAWSLLQGGEA